MGERNSMGKRRFNWVRKCFQHFFENFSQIDDNVKIQIINIQKSIEDTYDKNEKVIEDKAETAKDEDGLIQHLTYINQHKIQLEWEKLERIIEKKLKYILAQNEDLDRNRKWYSVLDKIHDTYKQK